jgi:hypothetical protein
VQWIAWRVELVEVSVFVKVEQNRDPRDKAIKTNEVAITGLVFIKNSLVNI